MNFTVITDFKLDNFEPENQINIQDLVLHNGLPFVIADSGFIPLSGDVVLNIEQKQVSKYFELIESIKNRLLNCSLSDAMFITSLPTVETLTFNSAKHLYHYLANNDKTWRCEGFVVDKNYENLSFVLEMLFNKSTTVTITEYEENLTFVLLAGKKTFSLGALNDEQNDICQKIVQKCDKPQFILSAWLSANKLVSLNSNNPLSEAQEIGLNLGYSVLFGGV